VRVKCGQWTRKISGTCHSPAQHRFSLPEYRSSLMLILLLVFSLFQTYYGATGQEPASIELRAVSACGDQDSCRSIRNIVLSCLATIFLCTWVAVHPNIAFRPDKPNAGWRERWIWDPLHHFWSYKLPLFIWALLVPEYILSWSMRQFFVAGQIQMCGGCFLSHATCQSLMQS
jgi:hypothetical protein